ncbi:jg15612 [Pararge aegeria aegeria]|uniref:Jg15612 protein n=1 Tax=Pararge aegeria aegeria TaxID=348720 RepID=A0A8S4RSM9_9NEOP|nr:jg15612 [Pararge aegeria aegeria]
MRRPASAGPDMAQATPRPDRDTEAHALGDHTNDNKEENPASVELTIKSTESNVESETIEPTRDSNDSHAPAYSDLNDNVRINKPEDESDADKTNANVDGESGRSKGKGFKESGEALELALLQLGPFGLYQRYAVLLLCLPNVLAAMYSLNYVFVAEPVAFR